MIVVESESRGPEVIGGGQPLKPSIIIHTPPEDWELWNSSKAQDLHDLILTSICSMLSRFWKYRDWSSQTGLKTVVAPPNFKRLRRQPLARALATPGGYKLKLMGARKNLGLSGYRVKCGSGGHLMLDRLGLSNRLNVQRAPKEKLSQASSPNPQFL